MFIENINLLMRMVLEKGKEYNPHAVDVLISMYAHMKTNNIDLSWDWIKPSESKGAIKEVDEAWNKYVITEILREMMSLTHYEKLQEKEFMEVSEYIP